MKLYLLIYPLRLDDNLMCQIFFTASEQTVDWKDVECEVSGTCNLNLTWQKSAERRFCGQPSL